MGAARQHNMLVFAKKYGNDMVQALNNTFVFFPVMLAQASLESGYGTSSAAKNKNNFFGVMSGGKTASFSTAQSAFENQINLFNDPNHPYIANGVQTAKTPYEQIRAIANSGYYSMNNDDTLPASLASNKGTFTAKQSADYYYNNLKGFVDDALFVLPLGKINDSNLSAATASINGGNSLTPIGILAPIVKSNEIFGFQI